MVQETRKMNSQTSSKVLRVKTIQKTIIRLVKVWFQEARVYHSVKLIRDRALIRSITVSKTILLNALNLQTILEKSSRTMS